MNAQSASRPYFSESMVAAALQSAASAPRRLRLATHSNDPFSNFELCARPFVFLFQTGLFLYKLFFSIETDVFFYFKFSPIPACESMCKFIVYDAFLIINKLDFPTSFAFITESEADVNSGK